MKKVLGIFSFLLLIYVLILVKTQPDSWGQISFDLAQRFALRGIVCLGVGMLIIAGGIDLSIGSVMGVCACVFCWLVLEGGVPLPLAALLVLLLGCLIGLINGLLVTYVGVQAFVVTLCGLFVYRGAARLVTKDQIPPIASRLAELHRFFGGSFLWLPIYLWLLLFLFIVATIFLHLTIYGRYFFALGSNERATRYSGIAADFYKILAYVLCSLFTAIFALVWVIEYQTVQSSEVGNFLELYAIAGAVLGGCSLRGGEGTTVGMLIGAGIMVLLPTLTNMWGIRDYVEQAFVGGALLVCAILDEVLRRRQMSR